ncbi:carcinoembryonic antigen-related cell adhesion molecule 5-like protein [Lates japonicus]|uniref:Carcinoembryonic antigen-related cell adhesion molecule 5-like protein n=1 Tax=Lates japonicus TaxID=270547 RepID=A0AAD3NHZ5_LATJO|nr:carcinoembryonic antigen-related cell adhesion molecule 5-like protein [Lates japonicus]
MDLFRLKSLLFLLFFIGRCRGQDILPEGPLDAVKTKDSGDYSINVISADGDTKTAEIKLRVLEPVSDVVIKSDLTEAIEHNSTVVLTCSAKGSLLTFTWTNGTTPIVADGKRLTLKNEQMSSTLTIAGVLRSDLVGPICCTAANKLEKEKSAPFNLTVYYGPDEGQHAKTKRTIPSPGVSFGVMEPITGAKMTGPVATLIAGNSTANLSCQVMTGTVKTRSWLKDGKPLSANSRLVFADDLSSIMINPLQKEDNGVYQCQLINPVTSAEASYKMVVNYGPEPATVTGESEVELDTKVTLTCSAASVPPANFTWKFNGTMTAVKTSQYIIDKAVYSNSGTYTCEAHNAVTGKTSKPVTHTLAVKGKRNLTSS